MHFYKIQKEGGALDMPTAGKVFIDTEDTFAMKIGRASCRERVSASV